MSVSALVLLVLLLLVLGGSCGGDDCVLVLLALMVGHCQWGRGSSVGLAVAIVVVVVQGCFRRAFKHFQHSTSGHQPQQPATRAKTDVPQHSHVNAIQPKNASQPHRPFFRPPQNASLHNCIKLHDYTRVLSTRSLRTCSWQNSQGGVPAGYSSSDARGNIFRTISHPTAETRRNLRLAPFLRDQRNLRHRGATFRERN